MSVSTDASTIRKSKTFHADVQNSLNLQQTPTTRCNKTRQRAATKPDKALQQNPTKRCNKTRRRAATNRRRRRRPEGRQRPPRRHPPRAQAAKRPRELAAFAGRARERGAAGALKESESR
jgi:hypothetical protein